MTDGPSHAPYADKALTLAKPYTAAAGAGCVPIAGPIGCGNSARLGSPTPWTWKRVFLHRKVGIEMTEIAKIAALARSAGMSYGKYVASAGTVEHKKSTDEPYCPLCPQFGGGEFCNAMNRPVEGDGRPSPKWCWLRIVRNYYI